MVDIGSKGGKRASRHLNVALAIAAAAAASGLGASELAAQSLTSGGINLTAEEQAERDGRKACKVKICAAFRVKQPGDDIACNVVKSWRKTQLEALANKARVSWPWGKVRCETDITLPRQSMITAMTEAKHELTLEKHTVTCTVARESETDTIKFSFSPKVSFEGGKAVKAALNWGEIEAPTLMKTAMWTATATDNAFNLLESTIVEDINDFIGPKCDEVKTDWATN